LLAAGTFEKAVRAVENQARLGSDVLISVDDAGRDDDEHRAGSTHDFGLKVPVRGRSGAGVPEGRVEVRGGKKGKKVGLVNMLVRTAGDAGAAQRDIGHGRVEAGG